MSNSDSILKTFKFKKVILVKLDSIIKKLEEDEASVFQAHVQHKLRETNYIKEVITKSKYSSNNVN